MRNITYIFTGCLFVLFGMGLISCNEQDYKLFDSSRTGIYFTEDSVVYSFGVTKLEVTSYEMKLPVKIMGAPVKEVRSFKVEAVAAKTTAEAGVHYTLPTELIIEPDSVNGVLPVTVLREHLGSDGYWQVAFRLLSTDDFEPEAEVGTVSIASFNNIVEPPQWKDWSGKVVWPNYKLGVWDPVKWVKLMEYFRAMEQTAPATYKGMVDMYGPNLENVQYGWMDEYNYAATKYILIPMYDFFAANPELLQSGKNDIPKPY